MSIFPHNRVVKEIINAILTRTILSLATNIREVRRCRIFRRSYHTNIGYYAPHTYYIPQIK
jgi:hypothetical protein